MDSQKQLDLGSWVGLQKAFANVSSGCSAARAQCLKQVRDSHMLNDLGFTWEEFCTLHAGISRRHADNLIHQYERFGDAYFRLTEIAPVSPKTFQQIVAQVTPDTIEINGQPLALTPENAPKIRAAIQLLRRQIQHPSEDSRPPADVIELQLRLDAVLRDAAKAFHAIHPIAPPDLDLASLRAFAAYGADKFRALSREFESSR
ncbi:MAG TPA: hypothetical protein VH640_07860 [Bryobacteraceae bacterium]|jgi:hypothetical protein